MQPKEIAQLSDIVILMVGFPSTNVIQIIV